MQLFKVQVTWFYSEVFEDTKDVTRIRISNNRQHNGEKKKYNKKNNNLQNMHIKLKVEYH